MRDGKLSAPLDDFKPRELEILALIAEGLSNAEIGERLFITTQTVRWYNKQIYSKLGTSRRTEAIALARAMGLLGAASTTNENTNEKATFHTLPITTGPFIGRDAELKELSDLLKQPDIRLLSLVAPGGMGKSRLSLELGHLIQDNYEHGAAFIDLAPVRDPDDLASHVVSSLKVNYGEQQSPEVVLFNYCREKELLLIFDNFEHVLKGANLLSDLLHAAPKTTMITTTRERLNLRTETVYYLQPVREKADDIFLEVASLMHPQVMFTDDDRLDIDKIVELVGGLPLALILAAALVDVLTLTEIAAEIRQSLDILEAEMVDMPARQRSIRAVIDPTWKRLSEQEQHALMWASVFRGGFARDRFQEVTGATIRTLQTLVSRSLVHHSEERRFDLHPLLRQYAREKLEQHHRLADAKERHLAAFLSYAQTHAERMYGGHYLESLDALEREEDNLRAALDWALQGNHIEQAVKLILAHGEFWRVRSRARQAITYVEKARQQSNHPKLVYLQSIYLDRLGDVDRANDAANYLITYGEANGDQVALAYGQLQSGALKHSEQEAVPLMQAALSNALEMDDRHLTARCQSFMAILHPEVTSYNQQALEIFEAMGDLHGVSRVTNNLAIHYYNIFDRQQEAKELMEYSLQLKRQIGDRAGEARRLTTISLWAIDEEELEQAQKWLAESREICQELGEQDRLVYALVTEGVLYLMMMDFERAQATLNDGLKISIAIKDYRGIVDLYSFLCQLHVLQNNLSDARLYLQKGVESLQQDQSQPTTLILAYANYLWSTGESGTCIPIVAALTGRDLNTYVGSTAIINKLFLQPLTYRIRQRIGDAEWQQVVNKTAEVPLEQIVQRIVDKEVP